MSGPDNTARAAVAASASALGLGHQFHEFTPAGGQALRALEAAAKRLWKAEHASSEMTHGQLITCTLHATREAMTRAMADEGVHGMPAADYVETVCNLVAGFLADAPDDVREAVIFNLSLAFTREGRRAQTMLARASADGEA